MKNAKLSELFKAWERYQADCASITPTQRAFLYDVSPDDIVRIVGELYELEKALNKS